MKYNHDTKLYLYKIYNEVEHTYMPYHSPINTEQSYRSISSFAISASTLYNHARVGLPPVFWLHLYTPYFS